MRIVSLIASSTEIVCALGLEDKLVGRSHECDFPSSILSLPVCTEPKFRVDAGSAEIDRQVKSILEQALSVYRVDADLLAKLQPTHIITQTQCEVCAVSLKDVEEALSAFGGSSAQIVSLHPNALGDVFADIQRVADALGVSERGRLLIAQLRSRMDAIQERARLEPRRRSVAAIEWIDPLMACANWMPDLIAMAGGHNLFGHSGGHSPTLAWLEVTADNPEVILILPCGFDITRTRQELSLLTTKPGWNDLKAVRMGHVYLLDGNQYFNRPGPRLAESLEILAEVIHPEAFDFGHEDTGWQKM